MPGFDGTGPRRLGPLTGAGRGFCILRLPAEPDGRIAGVAGQANWTVGQSPRRQAELTQLRNHALRIEAALIGLRGRIERMEASGGNR